MSRNVVNSTKQICGYCGRDMLEDMTEAKTLVATAGLLSEIVDPGGRVLVFSMGRELRLSDQCNACDSDAIKRFLGT